MDNICNKTECVEPGMSNGSGLCEAHFEARRDQLRSGLELAGPVPVTKIHASKKPQVLAASQYSAWKVALVCLGVVAFWFFYVLPVTDSGHKEANPTNFADAAADQMWRIDSENIVLLRKPEQPSSKVEFMNNVIAALPRGETVLVIQGRAAQVFKRVTLVDRPEVAGWIQSQTVSNATQIR